MSQINLINYSIVDEMLLPPLLRTPMMVTWANAKSAPLQWLHDKIFVNGYIDGDAATPNYINGATYSPGDKVIYHDRVVYMNTATASGIAPALPHNRFWWEVYNPSYIGALERSRINSQKIVLTMEINKYFQCTGIYFINNNITGAPSPFVMGNLGQYSSTMHHSSTMAQDGYMGNDPYFLLQGKNCFTVYVPIAVANSLTFEAYDTAPTMTLNRENIIRSFVNKYNLAGILYNIHSY